VDARSGSLFPPLQELKSGQHARARRSQQALSVATGKVRNFACSKAVIHERLKGSIAVLAAYPRVEATTFRMLARFSLLKAVPLCIASGFVQTFC
jgi:hypothetical protein